MKRRFGPIVLLVHLAYAVWGVLTHFRYPPRFTYASREVRRLMRRPCILIANHTAHTDGYYLPQVLPGKTPYTYVTRKWYEKPHLQWVFRRLRYIPVNLEEMDTEWLSRGREVLRRGGRVLFFPEGKLVPEGGPGEFHPGFLMLAKETGVPVIPIALCGEYRRGHRKEIIVGEAIYPAVTERGRPSLIYRRESEKCRAHLATLLGVSVPAGTDNAVPHNTAPLPLPSVPTDAGQPSGDRDEVPAAVQLSSAEIAEAEDERREAAPVG